MSESVAARWLRRLRTGEGVSNDWPGVCSITNGLLAAGLPESTIRTLLLDESNEGVRYVHSSSAGKHRPAATRERMVRDAIRKAHAWQARSKPLRDRGGVIEQIALIRAAIDDDPGRWTGRAGATDRAVLLGLLATAERLGRMEFDCSIRGIADEAAVGVKGAHGAIRRLRAWVRVVELGAGTRATRWRLEQSRGQHTGSVLRGTDVSCRDDRGGHVGNARRHDAFRWTGLGKSKLRVYELLGSDPVGSSEIATTLGIEARTARRHLHRLEAFDLAHCVLDGWVLAGADLDQVAVELGVAGDGERQREKHAVHSGERRKWLAERRRREREQAREAVGEVVSGTARRIDATESAASKVEAGAA